MQVLLNHWEILVKELFFNKISTLHPPNAIKTKFLANSFQGFCLLFRNKEQLLFVFLRLFVPNLLILGVVLKRSFKEMSCSESLDKTEEVINEGFISQ